MFITLTIPVCEDSDHMMILADGFLSGIRYGWGWWGGGVKKIQLSIAQTKSIREQFFHRKDPRSVERRILRRLDTFLKETLVVNPSFRITLT